MVIDSTEAVDHINEAAKTETVHELNLNPAIVTIASRQINQEEEEEDDD